MWTQIHKALPFDSDVSLSWAIVEPSHQGHGSFLKQVHGSKGWERSHDNRDEWLEGDWHFTFEENIPLVICVADCTAIMMQGQSSRGSFVAGLHAGWRGTADDIMEKAVASLQVKPGTLKAWLSPSICQNHFEVGPEVLVALGQEASRFSSRLSLRGKSDRVHLDLKALQRSRLLTLGAQIDQDTRCSFCERDLVSYRRDGPGLTKRIAFRITLIYGSERSKSRSSLVAHRPT